MSAPFDFISGRFSMDQSNCKTSIMFGDFPSWSNWPYSPAAAVPNQMACQASYSNSKYVVAFPEFSLIESTQCFYPALANQVLLSICSAVWSGWWTLKSKYKSLQVCLMKKLPLEKSAKSIVWERSGRSWSLTPISAVVCQRWKLHADLQCFCRLVLHRIQSYPLVFKGINICW